MTAAGQKKMNREAARRRAVYRYLNCHHGLSLAMLMVREKEDAFRKKYVRRAKQTALLVGAMVFFTVALVVGYFACTWEQVLASGLLKWGFGGALAAIALSMPLALVWAIRTGSVLNPAAYEQLLRYQAAMESAGKRDGPPGLP